MRKAYTNILRAFFCRRTRSARASMRITQAEMASILKIDDRAYIELEHGRACCSALTLALFLIYCSPDPAAFLNDLRVELEKASDEVA